MQSSFDSSSQHDSNDNDCNFVHMAGVWYVYWIGPALTSKLYPHITISIIIINYCVVNYHNKQAHFGKRTFDVGVSDALVASVPQATLFTSCRLLASAIRYQHAFSLILSHPLEPQLVLESTGYLA